MRRGNAIVALLIAVLLAPAASAAGSAPLDGLVHEARAIEVAGRVEILSRNGVLDLSEAVATGVPLSIHVAGGEGVRVTYRTRGVEGALDDTPGVEPPARVHLQGGRIEGFACAPGCRVALFAEGSGGLLRLSGEAAGGIPWIGVPTRYCGFVCDDEAPHFERTIPPGALDVPLAGPGGLALLPGARAEATGRVLLFMANATATLHAPGGATALDASHERRHVLPLGGVYEGAFRYLAVELQGASLAVPAGAPARLLLDGARIGADGTLRLQESSGSFRFAGEQVRFHDALVQAKGVLSLEASTSEPAAPLAEPVVRAIRLRGPVSGEASELRVDARVVRAPDAGEGVGAGSAAAAGGLALLLVVLGRLLLAPLYSRIAPARVLENRNRALLHGLIRTRPGQTLADLTRATGLGRMVVRHHARILEQRGLVVARREARRRFFYPSGDAGGADAPAALHALKDATRRGVARALVDGARTQREVAARAGLSQRLVSYHLARLERAGLVTADASLPRIYAPTPALERHLEPPDGGRTAGSSAS